MNGLAIDTTSEACSVAVLDRHGNLLQRYAHAPRQHGELLLGWIEELLCECDLRPAQLDAIWVSHGPGSFTSLRMGFSVATALAFALDLPVVTVSSLQALAARALAVAEQSLGDRDHDEIKPKLVLATLDARLGEVYAAWYRCEQSARQQVLHLLGAEQLLPPTHLQWPDASSADPLVAVGNGLLVAAGCLRTRAHARDCHCYPDCWPQAQDLFSLADVTSAKPAWQVQLPYLRKKVAEKSVMKPMPET